MFTIPVNVVVAQQLVPSQAETVSALLMGFAWGMAGMLFIPLTGWVADHASLHSALFGLLVFPALGFILTRRLLRRLADEGGVSAESRIGFGDNARLRPP
ncbi:MAG: hypothetical protein QM757_23270 [Paludibaculum sp.]